MKYFKILTIVLFSSVLTFYSCNDKPKTPEQETVKTKEVTSPNATTNKTPKDTGKVWHYTCSKGCEGGSAAVGNCGNCGSLLAHNAAFHANDNKTPNASPLINPAVTNSGQNAAGVWHYACGSGCAGGSGTAGACGSCGSALNHNQAYHQ
ncbi:MAG: hypothetical protein KUG68_10560 [Flavobacteriaceae bacterium]|nr:hypothetical protein [Flavobacteriaceae bacterium]